MDLINQKKDTPNYLLIVTLALLVGLIYTNTGNTESNTESSKELAFGDIEDLIDPICNGISFSELENLSYQDIKIIDIEIPQSQNWYENLYQAYIYSKDPLGNYLNAMFKDEFNANVTVRYRNNNDCAFNASIRINGDLPDHLDIENLITSLDVTLEEGNIFGITRFKLLIPETRRNDEEIFTTSLLTHLGFLSPRTFYVQSSINSGAPYKFIFQEKYAKEMLEYNGYREGPILEMNEEYVWNSDKDGFFRADWDFDKPPIEIGRVTNTRWANLTKENQKISLEALEAFNKALAQSLIFPSTLQSLHTEMLGLNFEKIYTFEAAARALIAGHQIVINHNRKFFYNKLSNEFIPGYYDGMPELFESPPKEEAIVDIEALSTGAINAEKIPINIEKLTSELQIRGLDMSEKEVKKWIDVFRSNLKIISQFKQKTKESHPTFDEQKYNKRETDISLLVLDINTYEGKLCNQYLDDCSEVSVEKNKNIFEKELIIDGNTVHLYASNIENITNPESTYIDNNFYKTINIDSFQIRNYGNIKFNIDENQKIIEFTLENSNQKVVVEGNDTIKNWKFIMYDSNKKNRLNYRSDENLLTGCLTFYNTVVKNIEIKAFDSHCEDSVNFINAYGNVYSIEIGDSLNDGLDIDSSDLEIKNIIISNSGNDCVDLSSGNYKLTNLELISCSDKGISIGESSIVEIKELNSSITKTGIAVKDSSKVVIEKFFGDNNKYCLQLYQKKQEFGPSKLIISNNLCKAEMSNYIQKGSIYEEN